MTTRKQLIDRWKKEPWFSVDKRLVQFCIKQATTCPPWSSADSDELFDMLNGLPFREEVVSGRDLRGSSFPGANNMELRHTDFSYCYNIDGFADCDLLNARLDHIRGEVYSITGRLVETSFRHARLRKAWMNKSTFERCDFEGADLTSANFRGSDLRGSSFRDAVCQGADFQQCDLRGCDFRHADLSNALFREVIIDRTTDLRGARLYDLVCEELRDNTGRLVMRETDLSLAICDETTLVGSDPIAVDRLILKLIIKYAKGEQTAWGKQLVKTAKECLEELRENPKFGWHTAMLEGVELSSRSEAEAFIQRVSMEI